MLWQQASYANCYLRFGRRFCHIFVIAHEALRRVKGHNQSYKMCTNLKINKTQAKKWTYICVIIIICYLEKEKERQREKKGSSSPSL